jgi:hypothetical protein
MKTVAEINAEKIARLLIIADDGGNADAILAAIEHSGDCPFVSDPHSYTCSKCQADHYREVAHAIVEAFPELHPPQFTSERNGTSE